MQPLFLRKGIVLLAAMQLLGACTSLPPQRNTMTLTQPRITPVSIADATPEQKKFLDALDPGLSRLNVVKSFARNPKLAEAWMPFARYILRNSTLPPRDREILILRIGCLNRSQYEFTQHVRVGKAAGLSDDDITRITAGADAPGWSAFEMALMRAADQLHARSTVDDVVWNTLRGRYDDNQLMDVVVTVGQYNLVSWYLNTLGTPFEEGVSPYPMQAR
jgi:4-carboxymuconolactone decarboxylase